MCKRIVPFIVLLVMVMVSAPGGFAEEPAPPPTPIATAVRPADDAVMVSVPAGEFLMGSVEGEASSDAELPQHPVDLDAYWIDRTEVTNRQFEAFVKATGHVTEAEKEGKSKVFASSGASGIFGDKMVAGADWRHPEGPDSDIAGRMENPVVHVTWSDAAAFCEWAGARLPSEAEWEKTCRGTDARAYPWGGSTRSCEYTVMWDPNSGRGCGAGDTALPVGSRPAGASPYGALDMSGNVWEWVNDWYDDDYYARSPAKNPPGPEKGTQKLGRGGSWAVTGVGHRCDLRAGTDTPTGRDNQTGFRCAASESAFKAAALAAETAAKQTYRVMFIGDCHSWFLDTHFPKLAASGDVPVLVESGGYAGGGMLLQSLWSSGRYLSADLKSLIAGEGKWDFVVLGVGYWFPDEYTDWAPKFDEAIKKAGAETVLTIVWPDKHDAYTIQEYVAVNDALASQLGARVAPVGVAVDRVMRERPELIQYVDEYHVNAYGWYLDLCVLYATMFERSPEGLAYRMEDIPKLSEEGKLWQLYKLPDGWQISEEDAAYLQQIAWDTVQEYQKP